MKKCCIILLAALLLLSLPLYAGAEGQVRLGALTGPTAMGMVKLLDEQQDTWLPCLYGTADELLPKLLHGEVDIAAIPANLAANVYNKTGGDVTVLAVNVLGVLYIGEYGTESVQSVADLKGKTILATGKGSTPEYFLRHVLTGFGLDPDRDVDIQWKSEPGEVVALLSAQGGGIAMLPQPYVTAAGAKLGEQFRIALSLSRLWQELDEGSACTTAVIVARREFLESAPGAAEDFLEEYARSVEWVNENPAEAALLCEEYGIVKAAVAEKAIPDCNMVCITGEEMRTILSGCLQVICDQDPRAVGGQMPGGDFYYG